jgi:hypothetical protein
MLTIPSEVTTLLGSGGFTLRWMLRIDLDGGAEGLWTGDYDVTLDEVVYTGLAGNMTIDPVDASQSLAVDQLRVTLSGLLSAVTGALDGVGWHQRPATVYLAFLDSAGAVVHAMPCFSGFLDMLTVQDAADGLATIDAMIESNNRELSRSYGRTRSDPDQRTVDPDDGFFKYTTAANTNVDIVWGRRGPQYPVRPK